MFTRTPAAKPPIKPGAAISTEFKLPPDRHELITTAWRSSGIPWPAWMAEALDLLESKDHDEIACLVTSVPSADRTVARLSLRMFAHDLERTKALSEQFGVPRRNIMIVAACLYSLQS